MRSHTEHDYPGKRCLEYTEVLGHETDCKTSAGVHRSDGFGACCASDRADPCTAAFHSFKRRSARARSPRTFSGQAFFKIGNAKIGRAFRRRLADRRIARWQNTLPDRQALAGKLSQIPAHRAHLSESRQTLHRIPRRACPRRLSNRHFGARTENENLCRCVVRIIMHTDFHRRE